MPKTLLRKLLALIVPAALATLPATAQNVAINTTGGIASATSLLDLTATNRGLLIPRMFANERIALPAPATGLLVYQVNDPAPYSPATSHGLGYYDGGAWVRISSGNGAAWTINGNGNTVPATNYLGTSAGSADDLVIRTNNTARMTISGTTGFVGINVGPPYRSPDGSRLFADLQGRRPLQLYQQRRRYPFRSRGTAT
ncbi:MAG: hypothetical protein IPK99_15855 [Flavobacteriales bacterium]|nr:hypothetical protein [Flavobacteriales bacterium]